MSLRNGVPVSSRRRVASPKDSRMASPQESASPPWCTSSRMTSVFADSVSRLCRAASHADLRVGEGRAVPVPPEPAVRVLEHGVQVDRDPLGRLRPLPLQVVGRRHHGHPIHGAAGEQLLREPEREGRLAGAGRRGGEEVAGLALEVGGERLLLPAPQRAGGAARRAVGEGGRQVRGLVGTGGGVEQVGGHAVVEANRAPADTPTFAAGRARHLNAPLRRRSDTGAPEDHG